MAPAAGAGFDAHMMAIALRLAQRGLGATAPNPSVGAVIADEATGEVIARGVTARGGRPHAETEALSRAGAQARGATLYVTLEPCSHHGATPPCADAVIAAGIGRVVCAIEDPDPRVAGRGLSRLRSAGIAVRTRADGARGALDGGRPHPACHRAPSACASEARTRRQGRGAARERRSAGVGDERGSARARTPPARPCRCNPRRAPDRHR